MATFKVGQRVRIVAQKHGADLIGTEATIVAIPSRSSPGDVCDAECADGEVHHADSWRYFAPLTDPDAEKFIESIKKLAREPQNLVIKERA